MHGGYTLNTGTWTQGPCKVETSLNNQNSSNKPTLEGYTSVNVFYQNT